MEIKLIKAGKIAAFEGNKKIGYLNFFYLKDVSYKRNAEISFIFVNPKHRRKGVATAMFNYLIETEGKNITWLDLWIGDKCETEETYKLYKKWGFEQLSVLEDYYRPGVATRFFAKRIN